jgi:diguanylate cyclase (GGDEF)-like protein
MRVLIVDDCGDTRRCLRSLLESHGYQEVRTAESGQAALDLLGVNDPEQGVQFDVVLTDLDMPGLDGIEVCRIIKATPHLRDLAVLILTGITDEITLEGAFAAGACDYITKPFSVGELLARVRSAANLKRQLDNCKLREQELVKVTHQLKQLNEELQRLSILDELTGIANRRFFNILVAQEWGRATRAVVPLSMILIDIDFFKNYNDYYGHPAGDRCLKQVAATLNSLTRRPGDCVARYGGEEFVVLLAHTGLRGALAVAETLRTSIEDLCLEHVASPVHNCVTLSLGVASTVPDRGNSPELLLSAADQAVYQAKREGRNCVRAFQGLLDEPQLVARANHLRVSVRV